MNITESFNKRTVILLVVLVVIGGLTAYFLYFKGMLVTPQPEPEKIARRMKIEVPPPDEKREPAVPPPAESQPQPQPQPVPKGEVKTAEAKKEVVPEKKVAAKKEKTKADIKKKAASAKTYKPWAIHVASYTSKDEAQEIIGKLKKDNYNAYITEFNLKGRQWYRVRIGFYATEKDAKAAGKKISAGYGISGIWTVRPSKKEISAHQDS